MQKRNGFSRGELVALGAVMSVAGALLVPVLAQTADSSAFERARDYARDAACMSNLKQISTALLMYQQDFDERMPKATLAAKSSTGRRGFACYGWADAVWPYLKNNDLLQCPSESHAAQKDPMKAGYTDYWLNTNVSGVLSEKIKSPALLITMGDGDGGSTNSTARYNLNALPQSWISTANSPARRHHDTANYAFADGHVKRLKPSEVGIKTATFSLK